MPSFRQRWSDTLSIKLFFSFKIKFTYFNSHTTGFHTLQRLPLTRAFEGFFSVCLNLSFRGRQSTVSMVFHAL